MKITVLETNINVVIKYLIEKQLGERPILSQLQEQQKERDLPYFFMFHGLHAH